MYEVLVPGDREAGTNAALIRLCDTLVHARSSLAWATMFQVVITARFATPRRLIAVHRHNAFSYSSIHSLLHFLTATKPSRIFSVTLVGSPARVRGRQGPALRGRRRVSGEHFHSDANAKLGILTDWRIRNWLTIIQLIFLHSNAHDVYLNATHNTVIEIAFSLNWSLADLRCPKKIKLGLPQRHHSNPLVPLPRDSSTPSTNYPANPNFPIPPLQLIACIME